MSEGKLLVVVGAAGLIAHISDDVFPSVGAERHLLQVLFLFQIRCCRSHLTGFSPVIHLPLGFGGVDLLEVGDALLGSALCLSPKNVRDGKGKQYPDDHDDYRDLDECKASTGFGEKHENPLFFFQ